MANYDCCSGGEAEPELEVKQEKVKLWADEGEKCEMSPSMTCLFNSHPKGAEGETQDINS